MHAMRPNNNNMTQHDEYYGSCDAFDTVDVQRAVYKAEGNAVSPSVDRDRCKRQAQLMIRALPDRCVFLHASIRQRADHQLRLTFASISVDRWRDCIAFSLVHST